MSGASLSIPGLLYVSMSGEKELAVLHVGPAVGWVALKGIDSWNRELSLIAKADVTEALCREVGVVLPERQPEASGLVHAHRAAVASNLVAVDSSLIDVLIAKGIRVHTVGSDRITGGFYYFAKGGSGEPVRMQGNLVEMIAPALAISADNAAVEACLDGIIARILPDLSGGTLSEVEIELAAALPALGETASEAAVKLQTLEGFLVSMGARAARYEERARAVVETLGQATRRGEDSVHVALFGDAKRVVQPEMEIEYAEGEAGTPQRLTLAERSRWFVSGVMPETMSPPAVAPNAVDNAAARAKEAAAKAAEDAAKRAAAEKAAAERAAAERAAQEKAAAERAAQEKAAAERAAQERAAAERAAQERAAAERAAAEKIVVAQKAAAEKAASEKAAAERAASEKEAAERAAEEEVAAEKRAAESHANRKAAASKAAGESEVVEGTERGAAAMVSAKAAVPGTSDKKKSAQPAGGRSAQTTTVRMKADVTKAASAKAETPRTPMWVWIVLALAAAVGAYYFGVMRHHG